jgi:hypothetical protein
MYAFLLAKTNESYVILSNAFPHLEAFSPRIHSDLLNPFEPDLDRRFLVLRFLPPYITNEFQDRRHTRIFQVQLRNKNLNKDEICL